ncbi:hypothetical protein Lal_00031964 [Lupinus albus]|nr:hypothetical protein Lal_00031964 [Lupinus albus]
MGIWGWAFSDPLLNGAGLDIVVPRPARSSKSREDFNFITNIILDDIDDDGVNPLGTHEPASSRPNRYLSRSGAGLGPKMKEQEWRL